MESIFLEVESQLQCDFAYSFWEKFKCGEYTIEIILFLILLVLIAIMLTNFAKSL